MNQFLLHQNDKSFNLPIIQKLINSYKLWQSYLPNFPQTIRHTLANKIDNNFIETIENIFNAAHNSSFREGENKRFLLEKATNKLDLLKFFLQIAWEIKTIDNKKFAALSENLYEIGKMLGGWMRATKQQEYTSAE